MSAVSEGADRDRRFVLRVLAGLLPAVACTRGAEGPARPPTPAFPSRGVPPAVLELGRVYLQAYPQERDRDELRRRLGIHDAQEPEPLRIARINAALAADIDADAMVDLEGWRLARTECRVYALASLS